MVVTGIWSRILLWNVPWENAESSNEKVERFPVILLMSWTSKIINHFFLIWNIIRFFGGGQKTLSVTMMRTIWSDLSSVDCCGCISVVELIMEIVVFFNWNVNECAGFKTAAEYNAFRVMISRSLKAWSVRFIPSCPFHCQQTDEDDCAVNDWTCLVYHHFHVSK